MEFHSLDYPLAVFVAVLVIKEGAGLLKYVLARTNGGGKPSATLATKLDLEQAKGEILTAVRQGQDELHGRISGVDVRVARLEGRP